MRHLFLLLMALSKSIFVRKSTPDTTRLVARERALCLTAWSHWVKKLSVSLSCRTNVSRKRLRVTAVLLFLTVFFLPLHFHAVTQAAELSKECSCVHGLLTQTGPATAQAGVFHSVSSWLIVIFEPRNAAWFHVDFQAARAPPTDLL